MENDPRMGWIEERVLSVLKAKADKFRKLSESEEGELIKKFLDDDSMPKLFFIDGAKEMSCYKDVPQNTKKKVVYFMKNEVVLKPDNIAHECVCGDLDPKLLENMHNVLGGVFLPVLSNPRNQGGLSEVNARELLETLHVTVSQLYVGVGKCKGETMLPLPPESMVDPNRGAREKDSVHVLETAVVTWTAQIKDALKKNPEDVFANGANPGPMAGINFWTQQVSDLNSIQKQLNTDKIAKVMKVLELTKSPYFSAFRQLCKEVDAAYAEAADNVVFLTPLKCIRPRINASMSVFGRREREELVYRISSLGPYFDQLSTSDDIQKVPELFKPIMHILLMVWEHSKYHNVAVSLVIFIRQICNTVIDQAQQYVGSEEIFTLEPKDAVSRLSSALEICSELKRSYFIYKQLAAKKAPKVQPWDIQSSALFERLDLFMERCFILKELCTTATHFQKLEMVVMGGDKGAILTNILESVLEDFNKLFNKFAEGGYDVLDVAETRFDTDIVEFNAKIKELEQRLALAISEGFQGCGTLMSTFKMIDSFAEMFERDFVQADLENKQIDLIASFSSELKDVQDMFTENRFHSGEGKFCERDGPPIYTNMPPVSGALAWVQGLMSRLEQPMKSLQPVFVKLSHMDEVKDVITMHASIQASLKEYESEKFAEWANTVDGTLAEKLTLPLLTSDVKTSELTVNFDLQLVKLLNEVKYFVIQGKDIPEVAMSLFNKAEAFRIQREQLATIKEKYNHMLRTMLPVEKPLLKAQMKEIDKVLSRGLQRLTWDSAESEKAAFIEEAMSLVSEAHSNLNEMKNNMHAIENVLQKWSSAPLLVRPAPKTYDVAAFMADHTKQLEARQKEITDGGKEIHHLLAASNEVLKVSKGAPAWRAYVEFINEILVNGIASTMVSSLQFLLSQIDPVQLIASEKPPLFDVKLQLSHKQPLEESEGGKQKPQDVVFKPALDHEKSEVTGEKSIMGHAHSIISDFYNIVRFIKRLDRVEGDFLKEMEENENVRFSAHRIQVELEENQLRCAEFRKPYYSYKHLWVKDISATLDTFLEEGMKEVDGGNKVPDLEAFEKKINEYKSMLNDIAEMNNTNNAGWLRIDARPIKAELKTCCQKAPAQPHTIRCLTQWFDAYVSHLENFITGELSSLEEFIQSVNNGLQLEVEEDDAQMLIEAMTHVRDVRVNGEKIDKIFDPLRATIGLLKKMKIELPESVSEQLETIPFKWEDTKKVTLNARETLGPLQSLQQVKVKEHVDEFREVVSEFDKQFESEAPFKFEVGVDTAYKLLTEWNGKISDMEQQADKLGQQQELFEVQTTNFREIKQCRQSLLWLKTVWDHVQLVQEIFSAYRNTLWGQVDVEKMSDTTKKLHRECKSLPRQTAKWNVTTELMQVINEMSISLPLVQDLRDDAMRERHWMKLMAICGKSFVMDDKLTLEALLKLELYKFQDSVTEIVEQSRAEIKIDLQLEKIIATWAGLKVEYTPFKTTGVNVLVQPSDIYEALDDNEVALQNMMGNRFMGFFEQTITEWKGKLGTVRSVLEVWLEVQRSWCSLESIFLGSEDIREQLPEDAKRFDQIDAEFREQMIDAVNFHSPIEVCTATGREEVFLKCQGNLEMCQKSLSDYLEVKKKKFPRFYFISPNDLVDILSKGRFPPAVQEHFSKFTDNTGLIQWEKDENGKPTGTALGCVATDGEKFQYSEPFVCEGAVEDWLLALMNHQVDSFRFKLNEAINFFVEYPRDRWIKMFCAQHCISAGQVWWTTEVNTSFERLEQGNEGAMKEYYSACSQALLQYANLVLGDLSKEMRVKIKTLITIDVHGRDIVKKLVDEKVDNALAFSWQSQLKYRWNDDSSDQKTDCYINICDAEFCYSHEYVGNPGRLVITALTDRCYITLTQALRLIMGGAPQGPAGTGKTETTKDLGRGLAIWVIVQNCSDQMTNRVTGNFFSGLAQTGAWGCFDEFNRITVEVLSVVATQYGSILEAIRSRKTRFLFEEEEVNCVWSIGAWITMNPGYAGRAELPENLKALFRPCAMVVPDFENIAEINLAGEGFENSKELAHKFVELYYKSKELLSKQHHYDWGLRAMTGVLRIAGGMKRADPDKTESQILMRAMRDTNLPKFVAADFGIFLGLIQDLFPKVDSAAVTNPELTKGIKEVIASASDNTRKLQPEENFVVKCVNLSDMMGVRHCVFVLGCAGSAKTELWKTLADAQTLLKTGGGRTVYSTLNPKSVTSNDLYGYVHPVTKEPYDGIIAKIMREYSSSPSENPKWVILDGDIDAEWIESMNTVMDDNKVLTLVSNERIPLTSPMRLIFEISHLRNASPATVSRAGVIYLNEYDVGWRPFVQTWVEAVGDQKVQTILEQLFDQFVQPTLDMIRKEKWEHVTPIRDFAMVQVICRILEAVLTPENVPPQSENLKDVYEAYFQFAAVWAIGGGFGSDKGADFRKSFDLYWRSEFSKTALKFPDEGSVFDYYIDPSSKKNEPKRCLHWREIVPSYTHDPTEAYARIMVPTLDTTRIMYLSDMMLQLKKPVMLVGNAGSAKTVILNSLLRSLDDEKWMFYNISFNSFTLASDLQFMLEAPLEKKTGSMFGPPGTKKLIYFIDDFNMPTPDKYGTQSAIALLRQQTDYGGFYDLKKLSMKKLENVQYVGAMNPTAGSFFIIDRMQRHFMTLATPFPEGDVLKHIYVNIMTGHASIFKPEIKNMVPNLVNAAVAAHMSVADQFLPTAVKFHYQWNLRALASVFQGLVATSPITIKTPFDMARLWIHETSRVYGDRMVSESDVERFQEVIVKSAKAHLNDLPQEDLLKFPNLWATFVEEAEGDQKLYLPLNDMEHLSRLLEKQLTAYNETFAVMNLVLFDAAMEHVCRISRIIDSPRGNAMLVGVGGSGKQSLTRLAAFIGGCEVFQIKLTASYNMIDFKEDLRSIYNKTGVKSVPTVFLFTDQQVFKESVLIYFNDILSLGFPPDLFNDEDKDGIINAVRSEAKQAGVLDTRDTIFEFYINKVRSLLHVVCCMSPVGDKFRNRCRKFPALTSCTSINWFFSWPQQALISVAQNFLSDVEMETPEIREACANHMAFVHESVGAAADTYRATDRREVYTTPKSYLELIDLYKQELEKNREALILMKQRLSDGLVKLHDAQSQVADMQIQLKDESVVVEQKKKETDELLVIVGQESNVAEEEAAKAAIEEEQVGTQAAEVAEFQASANRDLAAAEPAIKKAEEALNGLNKTALGELKGLASPPAAVLNVTAAVAYMLAPKGANLKKVDVSWGGAKKMMGDVNKFLETLQNYDKDNFPVDNKAEVRKFTGPAEAPSPEFNYEFMKTKSSAAAGLCDWVVNICIYHDIYLDVAPKRAKLAAAEQQLADANKKLMAVRSHVANLEARKAELQAQLEEATNVKNELVAKAENTAKRLNLAQRLVDGLKDEGVRWTSNVESLDNQISLLVGDVMLSSSFVAYIAPFSRMFREGLVEQKWIPDLTERKIPLTEGFEPMRLLTDASTTAGWRTEGLPADPLSTQNAAIITRCARFPLIIDPQLQAITWIAQREEKNGLVRLVMGGKGYLDKVIRALEEGLPMLIEKMGETIEAVLDNMIARAYIKKGTKLQVKLGDRDTDVATRKDESGMPTTPLFRVYMQTKLPNPHYIPEVQAQTTLVNFTVTEKGLEDQLLSTVVGHERPDLLQEQSDLVAMQNDFTIQLKTLEDNLLFLLATAEGDILSNEELIITLEDTKATVKDINEKAAVARAKEVEIAKAFEAYRINANRGSLIYFLMNQLNVIDHMYQYSLAAFNFIFNKALDKATPAETLKERVAMLQDSITMSLFAFVTRGLFERHRLIFSTQLAIKVAMQAKEISPAELDVLLVAPKDNSKENPVGSWLPDSAWGSVVAISVMEEFASLPADVEGSWKRWKEWCEAEQPESMPLPQEWKRLGGFQQLQIVRALRPDRMTLAVRMWMKQVLGPAYGHAINFDLPLSYEDSGPAVPIFFLLSPGVDATSEVRALGRTLGKTEDAGKMMTVSLGQGQEPVAEKALDQMYHEGGWAMLENIELVANWLPKLEKKLESLEEGGDPDFRCFLSAMPQNVVPVPILQKSIKLTNEPPSGLKANLKRAFLNFTEQIWEGSSKQAEFKAIIFSLCFFHSVVCERRKFGPMGWNRIYPFNPGDLKDCIAVVNNYLEGSSKIPWDDLRYLIGEIFYGGHITDNWDRRLCSTFLLAYVKEEIIEGVQLYPGFQSPPALTHAQYLEYIDETLERETPIAYGLHPNSEINFMTREADDLFKAIANLSPKGGGGEGSMTLSEKVKQQLDDILDKLPELFVMLEIEDRIDDRTPYTGVFLQECERMNMLLFEMGRSLRELDAGLRGDLSISERMEVLMFSLFTVKVPDSWTNLAWESLANLNGWLVGLLERQKQLADWTADLATPKVTWLSGLFNPQSFLTAVMQVTSRKNDWPLDKLVTTVDVTKKQPEEVEASTRDGAFIHGLFCEGARWDIAGGCLEDAHMKELYPVMPVILVKAALIDKIDYKDQYLCPCYKTQARNNGYVFTANLRSKQPSSKWVMRGVGLLMSVVEL